MQVRSCTKRLAVLARRRAAVGEVCAIWARHGSRSLPGRCGGRERARARTRLAVLVVERAIGVAEFGDGVEGGLPAAARPPPASGRSAGHRSRAHAHRGSRQAVLKLAVRPAGARTYPGRELQVPSLFFLSSANSRIYGGGTPSDGAAGADGRTGAGRRQSTGVPWRTASARRRRAGPQVPSQPPCRPMRAHTHTHAQKTGQPRRA